MPSRSSASVTRRRDTSLGQSTQTQPAGDVAGDAGREQVGLLEHGRRPAPQGKPPGGGIHRPPLELQEAVGRLKTIEGLEQRALACAVRPQEHVHFAGRKGEMLHLRQRSSAAHHAQVAGDEYGSVCGLGAQTCRLPCC